MKDEMKDSVDLGDHNGLNTYRFHFHVVHHIMPREVILHM